MMDVSVSEWELDGERSTNVYVRDRWDCASWKRSPTLDPVASEFWASCRRVQARTGQTPPPPLPGSAPRPDTRPPNCTLSTPSRNTQNMRLYSNFINIQGLITSYSLWMWLHVPGRWRCSRAGVCGRRWWRSSTPGRASQTTLSSGTWLSRTPRSRMGWFLQ